MRRDRREEPRRGEGEPGLAAALAGEAPVRAIEFRPPLRELPEDDSLAVVAAYQRALAAYAPDVTPGFVSLEGYLAGRLAIAGLERCGRDLDRECFLNSLRQADAFDIEGFALQYGADDNQGSDKVFLTVIGPGERYHAIESLREIEALRETEWLND